MFRFSDDDELVDAYELDQLKQAVLTAVPPSTSAETRQAAYTGGAAVLKFFAHVLDLSDCNAADDEARSVCNAVVHLWADHARGLSKALKKLAHDGSERESDR